MKRTICTAYFNHRHQRLKLPHSNLASNPNTATTRCHWHMLVNTYGATYAEVYDVETAEVFSQFRIVNKGGTPKVESVYLAEPRRFGDPIRRTSVHALFHDLEIADEK